jgi:tetratricopeptide (TPR) repeat protein
VANGVDFLTLAYSLDAAGDGDRALAVLDAAVADDAHATAALELKGELLRARGELRDAADVFARIARQDPHHPSAPYLAQLLSAANPPLPVSRPAPWPSAFVRLENFLDRARHGELLQLVTSNAGAFEPSTVGGMGTNGLEPRVDLDTRISFRLVHVEPILLWLRPFVEAHLPSVGATLGIAPFEVSKIELKCTAYGDGNFFSLHSDTLHHPTRRISFVYYFHRLPKRYSGGALLLYDGDVADPMKYFPERATRLDTIDNSIVFFPSGAFHEVTRVVSPSGQFEDARFTFAGHVHASDGGTSTMVVQDS